MLENERLLRVLLFEQTKMNGHIIVDSDETQSFVEIIRTAAQQSREIDLIMTQLIGMSREEIVSAYQKNGRDVTPTIAELTMRPEQVQRRIEERARDLIRLENQFPNLGRETIQLVYQRSRQNLDQAILALEDYDLTSDDRRVRFAFPLETERQFENRIVRSGSHAEVWEIRHTSLHASWAESYPWLNSTEIASACRQDRSHDLIQRQLNLFTLEKVIEFIPDVTLAEIQVTSHLSSTIDQIVGRIMINRELIQQHRPSSSSRAGLVGLPRPEMIESQQKKIFKEYCPYLFDLLDRLERDWTLIQDIFPDQTLEEFLTEPTFFSTVAVPEDWEDLYGEPAETRERVYAFVKPSNPDSMKFYSSEDLVSSFTLSSDFLDPGSRDKDHFNERQINRLLNLVEGEDSALETIIHEIKFIRDDAIQNMTEMSTMDGFRECLDLVLKVGMLMRGWSGEGEYPLIETETGKAINEVKLTDCLVELKKRLETDWAAFRELRLIKEREPTWKLTDQSLWERLIIVLDAEQDDSCIRMTSTLYVTTVWFCLDRFLGERSFDLDELEEIF